MDRVGMTGAQSLDYRHNALGIVLLILTILAVVARIFISAGVLDGFVSYTSEGGSFIVKFHLAAYAIVSVLILALVSRPFLLSTADLSLFRSLLRIGGALVFLTFLIVATSGVSATGFIIDTYLVAILTGLLLLTQTPDARRIVGECVIILMITSAAIAIGELVSQTRLLPFTEDEPFFRPTGLAGHPLALGAHIALTIGFVALTRWPLWLRAMLILVLFVGLAASGARLATLAGAAEILLLLCLSRWQKLSLRRERQAKLLIVLCAIICGALLVFALSSAGFLGRFNNSLADDNSLARVKIYQIFNYVSWRDIMLGMDANTLLLLVRTNLQIYFIESAPVFIILTLGLPAAVAFAIIIMIFFVRLFNAAPVEARIAMLVLIAVDLSNNGFATKNPDVILLTTLAISFLPASPAKAGRKTSQSRQVVSTTSRWSVRLRV
jgi:hypothetical protein